MCTIGTIFPTIPQCERYPCNILFKQCDLTQPANFLEPAVEEFKENGRTIRYLPLTRVKDKKKSCWSGINEFGVSFVAADSYLAVPHDPSEERSDGVFEMYLKCITSCASAKEAADLAVSFYSDPGRFKGTDIFMVSDLGSNYFIEVNTIAADKNQVICLELNRDRGEQVFAATNHMRLIHGAVSYENNHSTYLRLERALTLMNHYHAYDTVGYVLRDRHYGKSVWSICRSKDIRVPEEQPYYTQAAAIFFIANRPGESGKKPLINVEYVLNTNAWSKGISWVPFENGQKKSVPLIGQRSNVPFWP